MCVCVALLTEVRDIAKMIQPLLSKCSSNEYPGVAGVFVLLSFVYAEMIVICSAMTGAALSVQIATIEILRMVGLLAVRFQQYWYTYITAANIQIILSTEISPHM